MSHTHSSANSNSNSNSRVMTMSQVINARGKKDYKAVYRRIKTYKDLLKANVAFLRGKISETPYHLGPIDEETIPLVNDLVKINEAGFLSIEGQPALVETDFVEKTWKYPNGRIGGNWWYTIEQKPYICGFMPTSQLNPFLHFMKNKKDYYYQIVVNTIPSQLLATTFPEERYNVTRSRSHKVKSELSRVKWTNDTNINNEPEEDTRGNFDEYPICYKLLESTVYVIIAGREYNKGSVETLLLEFYAGAPR